MAFQITILETSQSFEAEAGEPILTAAQRHNVALAHDCQSGGCGTCRIKLIEGAVRYDDLPLALTEEEAAEGFALACQAVATDDLLISTPPAEMPTAEPACHTGIVRDVRSLAPDVTQLVLEVPGAGPLSYRPGQYIKIAMPDGTTRSFSMASMPQDRLIDFHIRTIAGGAFTSSRLPNLRAGDLLEVELPHGSFVFRAADYRPLIMVATGTGIAPIKAMLETLMDNPDCPPVSLYWGGRRPADLYLEAAISSWGERLYDFRYVPVISRPDSSWPGCRGYAQDAVATDFDDLSEHAIYICGSPPMIADCKRRFLACGASADHIYTEGFTLERPVSTGHRTPVSAL